MNKEKDITIYDIAKHLSVSATTVSRALKNNPAINLNTRKKIHTAAKELGYRHNNFASALRNNKTYTLGVIVPTLNSYFICNVLAGMDSAASKHGYNLIITQSFENKDKERQNAETIFHKRVDGLLISIASNTEDFHHLDPFIKRKIPIVFFDRAESYGNTCNITIDNYKAAYNITKHLIDKGCKRIMHIAGNPLRKIFSERIRGYQNALKESEAMSPSTLL